MLASDSKYIEGLREEIRQLTSYVHLLKQRYKALYEESPVLLRTINTQGIILDCNDSYAKALGYSKNELIGVSIFDTVAEESLELMRQSFEAWKKLGSVRNREVLLKRKDGTVFPALVNANSIYDDNGNIIGSNTVIHDLSEIYSDHGSKITIDIEDNVFCMCDKNRIEQVLVQIITNAIDFSPKGSSKIEIKLRKIVGKYAKIVVKDNGIGIKNDNLGKIFEKFYQLDTSIIREHGGAGLGLSICKGIIEGHDGKIWAYSRGPDTGT
ncbi:MAG: PAS domain-containing sensor histidine kinase, partial [Nitrosopumilales archaeon]|nr:PAS domain-containing sensor histidine kinase [Nitrosopumilales archaeon]